MFGYWRRTRRRRRSGNRKSRNRRKSMNRKRSIKNRRTRRGSKRRKSSCRSKIRNSMLQDQEQEGINMRRSIDRSRRKLSDPNIPSKGWK